MFVGKFHGNSGLGNGALTGAGAVGYTFLIQQMHALIAALRAVTPTGLFLLTADRIYLTRSGFLKAIRAAIGKATLWLWT
jgi:hypothetical protein